jgi:hypothetical protein
MCHAGLVNNSLVTDYDIGVLSGFMIGCFGFLRVDYLDYRLAFHQTKHCRILKLHKKLISIYFFCYIMCAEAYQNGSH